MRSLKNLPHDRVFFVGGCANSVKRENVFYIPNKQDKGKWRNSTANVKLACSDDRLSDDFILMNDDFFILREVKDPIEELNLHRGSIKNVYDYYAKKYSNETEWSKGMRLTEEVIKAQGIKEPLCYELHIPMVINKKKFLDIFNIKGLETINCLHKRSLYGNLYLKGSKYAEDVKVLNSGGFDPGKYRKFLSCSDSGFKKVKDFLSSKFAEKSVYEV